MVDVLGDYDLLGSAIGSGATGRVFRAKQRATGAVVALKVLRSELADDPGVLARFRHEGELLMGQDLPHVVAVRDLVEDGDRLALVLDLVDGPTLRHHLDATGPLHPAEACRLMAQVATGVAAAHDLGVVHRDLKPENVVLAVRKNGHEALVTDFGIARLADAATVTRLSQALGTPDYLAPEIPAGERPTAAADVYALGVMIFEALVGWRPFRGSNLHQVLEQHRRGVLVQPAGLPDPLWPLVQSLLHRSPHSRPAAAHLAPELVAAASGLLGTPPAAPTPSPPPGPLEGDSLPTERVGSTASPTSRAVRPRRRPATLAAAGGVCAAVLLGVGAVALRPGPTSPVHVAAARVPAPASASALPTPSLGPSTALEASPSPPAPPSGGSGSTVEVGDPGTPRAPEAVDVTSAPAPTQASPDDRSSRSLAPGRDPSVSTRAAEIRPAPPPAPAPAPAPGRAVVPRPAEQVVALVLAATDPKRAYNALIPAERQAFDDSMLPVAYDQEPLVAVGVPQGVRDGDTAGKGFRCWDRTARWTAKSRAGLRLYSFTAVGYWCVRDGETVIFNRQARLIPGEALTRGWVATGDSFGSGDLSPSTAYLRGTHSFSLANIVDKREELYIVATAGQQARAVDRL